MPWDVHYTVNKGSIYEFKSKSGPYPTIQLANERIKELKTVPSISDVHRRKSVGDLPSGTEQMERT